jgi:hypothetical protein
MGRGSSSSEQASPIPERHPAAMKQHSSTLHRYSSTTATTCGGTGSSSSGPCTTATGMWEGEPPFATDSEGTTLSVSITPSTSDGGTPPVNFHQDCSYAAHGDLKVDWGALNAALTHHGFPSLLAAQQQDGWLPAGTRARPCQAAVHAALTALLHDWKR